MQQQKMSVWMWLISISAFVTSPAKADVVQESAVQLSSFKSQALITKIPRLNEIARPATTLKEWLSQSPAVTQPQSLTQITGVRLNATADGVNVVLETAKGEVLKGSTSSKGNSLIVDISNAQLQLPGKEFRQENPVKGIATVTVAAPNANSVRVTVTGTEGTPAGKVVQSQQGLLLSITPPKSDIEITVTAQKRPENVQNVPISITALSRREIENADITSLDQIAAKAPNFSTFSPSRNFVLYSIRGLSNFNFLSRDPVAFYVDDVPYDYTGFLTIDLPDLERVEVLRGPQSTLYGRNAEAGVVNIITQKGV